MRAARCLTLSLVTAITTSAALVAPSSTAFAGPGPTVTVSAPATATGLVTVTATGNVDPTESDTASTMALLVNGIPYGATKPCVGNGIDQCPTTFTWDSSGLNGAYTLSARLVTAVHGGNGVDSAALAVTAVNPAPTVTVTSPQPGAVVKAAVTVHATGSIDLSQTDTPLSLQLWVDGAKFGLPSTCTDQPGASKACTGSFPLPLPAVTGAHSLQVTMATSTRTAASPTVPFVVFSATRTVLSKVVSVRSGRLAVLRGRAVTAGGAPLVGARVLLTVAPAVGKKHTIVVRTGGTGGFSLATKVAVNSSVTATVAATPATGASHAGATIGVLAPITCKADLSVRHGRFDAGSCTVPRLPDGTKVSLQYLAQKKWHVLGAGTTSGTTIPISFKFGVAGSYPVRLVLGPSKVYLATYGTPFTVKVS